MVWKGGIEVEILKLSGEGVQIGELASEELAALAGQPAFSVRLEDGRTVVLVGLTRDECRACAPGFLAAATITVGRG